MDRREQNIRIFFDTENWMRSTEKLRRAVRRSRENSRLITPVEELELPALSTPRECRFEVSRERTLQAAARLGHEHPQSRICVLNFASATNPGGGVRHGSSAQEESLCRCSTLYGVLTDKTFQDGFYQFHRERKDTRYTDTLIYSPDIVICKSDAMVPERLPEKEWMRVDVITCAAPNLRQSQDQPQIPVEEVYELQLSRAKRILEAAAWAGADYFVGGAFGCGAFRNDPAVVARAWKDAAGDYTGRFDGIVFAVFCTPTEHANYDAFEAEFSRYTSYT